MLESSPNLLTVPDVARLLSMGEAAVRRRIASGALASVRIGRSVRVRREDADAYLARMSLPSLHGRKNGRPFSLDDPLWSIVGMFSDPDFDSRDKHKVLADAYSATHE